MKGKTIRIHRRYRLSWYDSLIVAAAQQAGCKRLYSEDLQHGQQFGTMTIHNPFL
jgi:predicted nucleic acid-binding protein